MDENKIYQEELEKLNQVLKTIDDQIEKYKSNLSDQKHSIIGFTEGLRGTQFNRQALMSMYATEENRLRIIRNNPYFGKFVFRENGVIDKPIYIGKKTLIDNEKNIIAYDWRSDICSMYYDYNIGPASYQENGTKVLGEILNKRQINIKNGILESVDEQDALSDDSILIKYLSENTDSRLKSIIATIQREQNKIIRRPLNNNYIVQGVAGSGKTTVALHRIAYLLYNEAKNINEADFMILGPNKYFLNYISELLPELDIDNVEQSTFDDIALSIIKGKMKVESKNMTLQNVLNNNADKSIIQYKSSIEYLKLIEEFIDIYVHGHLKNSIEYGGLTLCDHESIETICTKPNLFVGASYNDRIKEFSKKLSKEIKTNSEDLCHDYWMNVRNEFLSLSDDDPRRKELGELKKKITDDIKKGCPNQIKEYFSFLKTNPITLYEVFIDNIDILGIDLPFDIDEFKKQTLERLRSKKISSDDLAAILYIHYLINDISAYKNYSHVVIDEGQDLSLAQYYILRKVFANATFDVYGDIDQSIYDYQAIKNWNDLNSKIFYNKAENLELNKSYRTTTQISNTANLILDDLNHDKAQCISRDGSDILVNNVDHVNEDLILFQQINDLLNKKYETIAIICKDDTETIKVYKKLLKKGLNINIVSENNEVYSGGVCVIPSYLAKGLEFDAVILYNANNANYSNSDIDMKLLYVAITRAMHELYINYTDEIAKPLKPLLEMAKVLERHKR